jgi:hypothetical protein
LKKRTFHQQQIGQFRKQEEAANVPQKTKSFMQFGKMQTGFLDAIHEYETKPMQDNML